jgi:putative ABC transport system permease protein
MPSSNKPALPWSTAARIAWRELRASRTKFLFVLLSVAIGVAALTGVRGFSQSFQKALLGDARGIMAADLSARLYRLATPKEDEQLAALASKGVERTSVTETVSMASVQGDPVPLLVSLKAVDPAVYPFYGKVILNPAGSLRDVLTDSTALVDDNLLVRLNAKVGDRLKIGGSFFRIAAVIVNEPDRMSAGVGLGPRVMITRHALLQTGLLGLGSRASERYLFKIDAASKQVDIATLRPELEKILPDAQITDFRETSPELTRGLDSATGLLSLICLVAMVLGAIGVAMAMRAHLQQRIEILAIMKSIGARSSDILRIYLLQTVFLGLVGGLIGVALGLGVEYVFPTLLGSLLPLRPPLALAIRPVGAALATGILTTVLFCLPPLLDVRRVRPIAVLRKMVEAGEGGSAKRAGSPQQLKVQRLLLGVVLVVGLALMATWIGLRIAGLRHHTQLWPIAVLALDVIFGLAVVSYDRWILRFRERKLQWLSIVVIVAGLAGIAAALSDSWVIGRWFAATLCATLVFILGLSAVTLRLLRSFLAKTRLHLPSAIRHGLANLYRPGNQSSAVLAALGAGVMLILAVFLMQGAIVRQMHDDVAQGTPNIFLVDIAAQEIAGVESLLAKQPGVQGKIEMIPVISSRITSIDGVRYESHPAATNPDAPPVRRPRTAPLSWAAAPPPGTRVTQGQWWKDPASPSVAVVDHVAQRLGLHVGSKVDFAVSDRTISTTVTAIYKVDGQHAFARSEYILAPDLLKDVPATWYGAIHVAPASIAQMERTLFASYPTITVINLADILQTIQDVAGHIVLVIRFLAGFSMLSGAIILASSVASTRFRRIREVVVLKTLGATRGRIAQVFSVEFLVLGLLSGAVGAIFANLLARILLSRMDVTFHLDYASAVVTVLATAVLATATGWIASFRILGQKPLEVLREE